MLLSTLVRGHLFYSGKWLIQWLRTIQSTERNSVTVNIQPVMVCPINFTDPRSSDYHSRGDSEEECWERIFLHMTTMAHTSSLQLQLPKNESQNSSLGGGRKHMAGSKLRVPGNWKERLAYPWAVATSKLPHAQVADPRRLWSTLTGLRDESYLKKPNKASVREDIQLWGRR